ncbi:PDZ domain [Aphelenchoides avenae]|nr:PDZ domain [Aphelenchus avenae]
MSADLDASSTTIVAEDVAGELAEDAGGDTSASAASSSSASASNDHATEPLVNGSDAAARPNGTAAKEELVNGGGTPESNGVSNLVEIRLEKGDRGLGFNIVGGADEPFIPGQPGIFVSRIRAGTPSDQDGRIKVGDRIVNGIELTGKTHQEAVDVFKQLPAGACHLVVEADAENTILTQPAPQATTPTNTAVEPLTQHQKSLKSILKQKQQSAAETNTETGMAAKVALQKGDGLPTLPDHITVSYAPVSSEENTLPASSSSSTSLSHHPSSVSSSESPSKLQRRNRSASSSSSVVTVASTAPTSYAPTLVAEEDDEDRQSTLSLAPSVRTLVDDIPPTPKRPSSIFDPTNPSVLTEALFLSIGTVALGVGILFAYRYFKRR